MVALVGIIEFEVVRSIGAPIEQVFARLADIEGHNDWMPKKGTMLKRSIQTSPGEAQVGTTYIDETIPVMQKHLDRATQLLEKAQNSGTRG